MKSESWTLKANDIDKLKAFEMICYGRMLQISWTDHRTNNSVTNEIGADGEQVAIVRKRAHDWSAEPLHIHF